MQRLTQRGRFVFFGLPVLVAVFVVVMCAVSLLSGNGLANAATGPTVSGYAQIVVKQGDTLWTIAEEAAAEADPRDVLGDIVKANDLTSADLRPGQLLHVPHA